MTEPDDLVTAGTVLSLTMVIAIFILIIVTIVYLCYLIVYISQKISSNDLKNKTIENLNQQGNTSKDVKCEGFQKNDDGTMELHGSNFSQDTKVFVKNLTTGENKYISDSKITETTIYFTYNKNPSDSIEIVVYNKEKVLVTIPLK